MSLLIYIQLRMARVNEEDHTVSLAPTLIHEWNEPSCL